MPSPVDEDKPGIYNDVNEFEEFIKEGNAYNFDRLILC